MPIDGYRIIAGPALSPPERVSEAEWLKRDLADAQYLAEDEERLRHLSIDYEQPPAFWGDDESINLCASNFNPLTEET